LVTRRRLPPPASAQVYELTPWGYEAEPIIQTLGRWAVRSPGHDATLPISATSIMLSFRTWWDERKADGFAAAIGFRLGSESFVATPAGPELKVARADPAGAQAVFIGEPSALGAAAYGKQPLAALESAGLLRVEGDIALARRFLSLFELPPKAG
jgi:hypothetical protein